MYTDGVVNQKGTGVGIFLVSPEKIVVEKSLWLGFPATNNEAEYEALLARMAMVGKLGGEVAEVYSDSQLVVRQVNGKFEARDIRMSTQTGQVNVGGAAALFSFTTTTNQPALSLDLVSANMSPAGSPVQVDVYNASGTLLGSTIGAGGTLLDLPPLPAGSYTVVVDAQNESTGSFQMELINTPVGAPSDGPLPPWTYLVLGAGLLAMLVRRERTLGRMV